MTQTRDVPAGSLVGCDGGRVYLPEHPAATLAHADDWNPGPDGDPWVILTLYVRNLYGPSQLCKHALPAAAQVAVYR